MSSEGADEAAGDEFEPHYYIGKMYVDAPGHTSWEGSHNVTPALQSARDLLDDSDPESREGRVAGILDEILEGVPRRDRLASGREHTDAELRAILDELDDNELAGLKVGMLPACYQDEELSGADVSWLMNEAPGGHL